MKVFIPVALWATLSSGVLAQNCQADKCFPILKLNPPLARLATTVCQKLLRSTPPATLSKTTTTTVTTTVTPSAPTNTVTVTTSTTSTQATVCTTTVTQQPLSTSIGFPHDYVVKRQDAAFAVMAAGCTGKATALTAKVSKACSCFLTPTATRTVTATATSTTIKGVPAAVITTVTTTVTATTQQCTSTSTSTIGDTSPMSCGMPVASYTSGSITCANTAAAPSATNARFRIEGNDVDGTLFEGCLESGPKDITTPSGGTHKCDGTNNNANPNPGATLTTQIDAAGRLGGFDFDGTYSTQFDDFFITRIGQTASTGSQFWGVLRNEVFTSRGGCQEPAFNGDRGLWAFEAFNARGFLRVSPDYAAVAPGTTVTVAVNSVNPNSGTGSPFAGASLSGRGPSDASGQISFTAPTERGCYVLKATASGQIRSNAFYLSVF